MLIGSHVAEDSVLVRPPRYDNKEPGFLVLHSERPRAPAPELAGMRQPVIGMNPSLHRRNARTVRFTAIGVRRTPSKCIKKEYCMDEMKRERIIAYLRNRMKEFGIKPDDLASALASEQTEARYLSATGDTWTGEGEMPQWLKQAISAGQSIEHFQLSSTAAPTVQSARAAVDWRDDPFAGTPLARGQRQ
jgi:DNA-binding protein H-NS